MCSPHYLSAFSAAAAAAVTAAAAVAAMGGRRGEGIRKDGCSSSAAGAGANERRRTRLSASCAPRLCDMSRTGRGRVLDAPLCRRRAAPLARRVERAHLLAPRSLWAPTFLPRSRPDLS